MISRRVGDSHNKGQQHRRTDTSVNGRALWYKTFVRTRASEELAETSMADAERSTELDERAMVRGTPHLDK